MKGLNKGPVMDFGFGAGAFLRFLKSKDIQSSGIDSNADFVKGAAALGYDVVVDDLTTLETIKTPISNAICDNVLEHLERGQIDAFFKVLKTKMQKGGRFVAIVPDKQGYKKDPTHCTFVDADMMSAICTEHGINLEEFYRFPFNSAAMGKVLYLNMQIFVMSFP